MIIYATNGIEYNRLIRGIDYIVDGTTLTMINHKYIPIVLHDGTIANVWKLIVKY